MKLLPLLCMINSVFRLFSKRVITYSSSNLKFQIFLVSSSSIKFKVNLQNSEVLSKGIFTFHRFVLAKPC